MYCPKCDEKGQSTLVRNEDSRPLLCKVGSRIRKRFCPRCGVRFKTEERILQVLHGYRLRREGNMMDAQAFEALNELLGT